MSSSSSGGVIGRLPTPASSAYEDSELELLELQLQADSQRLVPLKRSKSFVATRESRHSLMTLWNRRALLDECQAEQIRRLLANVTTWDFNAFSLDRLTNGNNLATLCTHLLQDRGLLLHFGLDSLTVWRFFHMVEQGYHGLNPYHNSVHASDVTQAINCFLREEWIGRHLTPLEFISAIIASVCHDLDHPGRNEKFLLATSSHLAGMYNSSSVLENHHWRSALSILWESGLADQFDCRLREEMMAIVKDMIMATDISRQQEYLTKLRHHMEREELDMSVQGHRLFVLQIAMKCADISNPCRSWNISRLWSYRACEEFYRQGDKEMEFGLTVTPFCDRYHMSVAKVQAGFYRFVASPLFEEWNRLLTSSLSMTMLLNMTSNQARWDLIVQQEARNLMAESVASSTTTTTSSSSSSSYPTAEQQPDSRRESIDPAAPSSSGGGRRHRSSGEGDDDSDPCSSFPYLPLNSTSNPFERRHSLPLSGPRLLLQSRTSSEESAAEESKAAAATGYLQRQYSLVERRRIVRQNELAVYPNYRLTHKRRMFASSRSPIQTVESESPGSSFENEGSQRVTFHLGEWPQQQQEDEEDKENELPPLLLTPMAMQRRGSAPSSLLFNQKFGAISLQENNSPTSFLRSKTKNSLTSRLGFLQHRRGSLPADLVECGERLEDCGQLRRFPCLPLCAGATQSSSSDLLPISTTTTTGKKRKVHKQQQQQQRRRKSGEEHESSKRSSHHHQHHHRTGKGARRGSEPPNGGNHLMQINFGQQCGLKGHLELLREQHQWSDGMTSHFSDSSQQQHHPNVRRGSLPTDLLLLSESFVK